ncbi:hypothetical protein PV342_12525 [Streptomyces sp. PA03-3a]|nr:hypothetical protein [Streptomyces sp. PA03-3a]
MGHLPTPRSEDKDRLVLDSAAQAIPVLIGLAHAWREEPKAVDSLLADIADQDDQARAEAHLDGLGSAEHVRDQLADQLLARAGGAQFWLDRASDRHAAHQARRIAEEARRLADRLDRHAHLLTLQVEKAERERAARDAAETAYLRGVIKAAGLTIDCKHCSCWVHHANGLPCHLGCGTPGHAMTEAPETPQPAHAG